jgi:hypothetical protein
MLAISRRKFTNIHFRICWKSGICIELKMDAKAEYGAENNSEENYEENDDDITGRTASIRGSWQRKRSTSISVFLAKLKLKKEGNISNIKTKN